MASFDEILKAMMRDLEKKLRKEYDEKIEKVIKPQIKEELRAEYEAEIEALLEEIELYHNEIEMFGVQKCTNLQRMDCVSEQRMITVRYLVANGWITDKNIMKSDVWNGTPIIRNPRGGRTIYP